MHLSPIGPLAGWLADPYFCVCSCTWMRVYSMCCADHKSAILLDLCVSSLRRGHANLLCIVPIFTDDHRSGSYSPMHARAYNCLHWSRLPKPKTTSTQTYLSIATISLHRIHSAWTASRWLLLWDTCVYSVSTKVDMCRQLRDCGVVGLWSKSRVLSQLESPCSLSPRCSQSQAAALAQARATTLF